jgi:Asp-tRNA(Asn)/Glu-tRNA(Gln) amidotransferase A subunit family amidase
MIAEALKTAQEHDEYQNTHNDTLGPLHGVPYTLKDTFNVAGCDTTVGLSRYVNQPAETSSPVHTTLIKMGAIFLSKTNVPQTLLSMECNNPLFGKTTHPVVSGGFTCGGSSGGEAAVLARNGTAIGFGTDIGGSLRIPAGWSGVCSLKPTKGRYSIRAHRSKFFCYFD